MRRKITDFIDFGLTRPTNKIKPNSQKQDSPLKLIIVLWRYFRFCGISMITCPEQIYDNLTKWHVSLIANVIPLLRDNEINIRGGVMVFNATFNNISVDSWRRMLLVDETGVLGENHRPAANQRQPLSHNVVHLTLSGIRNHSISGDRYRLHRQL